nr:MAG TPA: hypothetical protein [Caudoviricetes sp.]
MHISLSFQRFVLFFSNPSVFGRVLIYLQQYVLSLK